MASPETLPTHRELQKLSPRARVAYAARCARRVQPLQVSEDPRNVEAVENAITVAERFAGGEDPDVFAAYTAAADTAEDAHNVAMEEVTAITKRFVGDDFYDVMAIANREYSVRNAIACVADTAAAAAYAARAVGVDKDGGVSGAWAAASSANFATRDYNGNAAITPLTQAIWGDYRRLLRLYPARRWRRNRPVDMAKLGPLWPDGEPDWYTRASA